MSQEELDRLGEKAQDRIRTEYSWGYIYGKYDRIFALYNLSV